MLHSNKMQPTGCWIASGRCKCSGLLGRQPFGALRTHFPRLTLAQVLSYEQALPFNELNTNKDLSSQDDPLQFKHSSHTAAPPNRPEA